MILSVLIFVAFLGGMLAYIRPTAARATGLWTSIIVAVLAFASLPFFGLGNTAMQFVESISWITIESFDIGWHLGVDGISYPMVLLTALLGVVAVLVSRREINTREGKYYAILLGLLGSIIGVFAALDLVLFFIFWEFVLILMFLMILMWGLTNRKYAAMKFLIYTGFGSVGLLLAIILLGVHGSSVHLVTLASAAIPTTMQYVIFCLLLFAFFIKMPIVPFHTWLPDAHVEAPTAGSILLAGVLLKMGAYGLLRIGTTLLSDVSLVFSFFLFVMGTLTVLYGAFVSLAQKNLKKIIAYSSVNHMGLVLLGIATGSALGITGAVFEMVSHGLIAGLLFALAGLVHQKAGTFDIDALHGLIRRMPRTSWLLALAALGGLGLPSMTGFIAEFLVFFASFKTFGLMTIIPLLGIIVAGGYFVRMIVRTLWGRGHVQATEKKASMLPFAILTVVMFVLGVFPFLLISIIASSVIS